MLMMSVMRMQVLMFDGLVMMCVLVVLREMQPNPGAHEHCGNRQSS